MIPSAEAPPATTRARAALERIRVVEFGFAAAGPLVGKYLADHGAEVIHVESSKAPDPFRTAYPPFKDNIPGLDRAAMFAFYNQGKLGVSLDLKHPRGPELARALIARADVVIESFTPGHMAKWGLDHATLRRDQPALVMLSTCNQGQTGPHSRIPGYGSQLTALAGFLHLLGEADGTPVLLYGPYIDYIAVGHGVVAILAALLRRRLTGQGCYIDLSQYESGLQFLTPALLEHAANGTVPTRCGDRDLVAAPHGVYRCADLRSVPASPAPGEPYSADVHLRPASPAPSEPHSSDVRSGPASPAPGEPHSADVRSGPATPAPSEPHSTDRWCALSVWDDLEWRRLGAALGSPEWANDPRFATAAGRREHQEALDCQISAHVRHRERDELCAMLRSANVHAAPVLTISELFTDPQLASREFWRTLPHDVLDTVVGMAPPFALSATPARLERAGPLLGADNDRVFGELLGLGQAGVDRLRGEGVLV